MKKAFLLIATLLLTLVLVSCTNADTSSGSVGLQDSFVSSSGEGISSQTSENLQGGSDSSSDENSEWGDIEFPRP